MTMEMLGWQELIVKYEYKVKHIHIPIDHGMYLHGRHA